MENIPAGTERTEITEEMPQEIERRLVLRLLAYWRFLCRDNGFASFTDIDPTEIPDLWPHCFILEVLGEGSEPVFRSIGNALATNSNEDLTGQNISVVSAETLIGTAIDYTDEVLQKGVPVSRGGEFVKADGTKVLYRSILLPLSDDGETIRGLFGAANCREIVQE